jgi:hypothetical protein
MWRCAGARDGSHDCVLPRRRNSLLVAEFWVLPFVELEFCLVEREPDHRPSELWETTSFNGDKFVADIVATFSQNKMTFFTSQLTCLSFWHIADLNLSLVVAIQTRGWQAAVRCEHKGCGGCVARLRIRRIPWWHKIDYCAQKRWIIRKSWLLPVWAFWPSIHVGQARWGCGGELGSLAIAPHRVLSPNSTAKSSWCQSALWLFCLGMQCFNRLMCQYTMSGSRFTGEHSPLQ